MVMNMVPTLKQKLADGGRIYGCAVVSASVHWPRLIGQAGLDFVFIDTEHITLGRETVATMCQWYRGLGIAPIVRIPSQDPDRASQTLDDGAAGVLAPYIETVEQVQQLVGAVKWKPIKGQRLQEIMQPGHETGTKLADYLAVQRSNRLCWINVESVPALKSLELLLAVPGLDGIIIGPHDLSCSLGIPEEYEHPKFIEAASRIVQLARSQGLGVGMHLSLSAEMQLFWAKRGVNIVLHSSDMALFQRSLLNDMAYLKKNLGDVFEVSLPGTPTI